MSFDPVFSGLWLFGAAPTTGEPVASCWNWNEAALVVTEIALSNTDEDLVDRTSELATLQSGDRLNLRSTTTADNWAAFDIVTVTDNTTWTLLEVDLVGVGTVPGLPAFRQRVLFDFLRTAIETAGPISSRFDQIVGRVAANLHVAADDAWVASAVDSAIEYAIIRTNRAEVGLPDTELTVNGLVGFAERLYMDAFSPNGAQVSVADPSFEPVFQPEELWKHWRHYFTVRQLAWGVA